MAVFDEGYLKIDSKEDRWTVAEILFKNGYTVFPARSKKNGKANFYLVGYRTMNQDLGEEGPEE